MARAYKGQVHKWSSLHSGGGERVLQCQGVYNMLVLCGDGTW